MANGLPTAVNRIASSRGRKRKGRRIQQRLRRHSDKKSTLQRKRKGDLEDCAQVSPGLVSLDLTWTYGLRFLKAIENSQLILILIMGLILDWTV